MSGSDTPNETSGLLGNFAPPKLTKTEQALRYFGWTCTLLAMSAQGFQGMMLMDYLVFQKLPFYGRILLDAIFLVAVEESKRRVVTKHNEQNFINLASIKRKDIDPRNWSAKQFFWQILVNLPLTFGGTYVFVAITGMSLDADVGGASLLNTYNKKFFTDAGSVFNSRGCQIPFMMAAMFANALFFPTMINLAYNNLKSWVTSPFESADYRSLKEQVATYFEKKRRELKTAYENNGQTDTLLKEIHNLLQGTFPKELRNLTPNTATKNVQRTSLALLTLLGAAVGCIGFFSIYKLGGKPAAIKMIRVFSKQEHSNFIKLAPVFSVLSYGATMSICIALAPSLLREIPRFRLWAGDNAQIKVSSNFGLCLNAFYALVICGLGTLPFIYQADQILHESTWLIIMVGMASLSIEAQSAREKCSPINNGKDTWYGEAKAYITECFTACRQSKEDKKAKHQENQTRAAIEKADRGLIALQNDTTAVEAIINEIGYQGNRFQPWASRLFCCCRDKTNSQSANSSNRGINTDDTALELA